jgi:Ca2+-binding RTX toxin-like protein
MIDLIWNTFRTNESEWLREMPKFLFLAILAPAWTIPLSATAVLQERAGWDSLEGNWGDDLLNGGGGCDIFALRPRGGINTIQDVEPGQDLLMLPGRLNFNQLAIRQQGQNTLISIANRNRTIAILEYADWNSTLTDFFCCWNVVNLIS